MLHSGVPEAPFEQPIVVLADSRRPAAFIDVVSCTALASVLVFATEVVTYGGADPSWDSWAKTGRQRTVLRANKNEFKSIAARHGREEHALIVSGKAKAIALRPVSVLPKSLTKLAECRAIFPVRVTDDPMPERHKGFPVVAVDVGLDMLAADAAAHAAESILTWFLTLSFAQQATWYDTGCLFSVIGLAGAEFTNPSIYSSADGSLSVTPSGRTASFLMPPPEIKVKHRN